MGLFNFRLSDKEKEQIKANAQKENRSISSFVKNRALEDSPNLVLGDWWTDTTKLREIIKAIKKQKKK